MAEPRLSDILTIAEEELSRIVLDIHDGPVQYIFTALSILTGIQEEIAHDPAKADLMPDLAARILALRNQVVFGGVSPAGISAAFAGGDYSGVGAATRRGNQYARSPHARKCA